jgi:hypothetical protein
MVDASKATESRTKLRGIMYARQPRLGAFFSCAPIRLGLFLSAGAAVLLMVPALIAHVALIKDIQTRAWPWVGFWQRWNWAGMYVIILPLIFAGTAALSQFSLTMFGCLTDGKYSVVKKSDGTPAIKFADAIAGQAARYATPIFWTAVVLTVLLTVVICVSW